MELSTLSATRVSDTLGSHHSRCRTVKNIGPDVEVLLPLGPRVFDATSLSWNQTPATFLASWTLWDLPPPLPTKRRSRKRPYMHRCRSPLSPQKHRGMYRISACRAHAISRNLPNSLRSLCGAPCTYSTTLRFPAS